MLIGACFDMEMGLPNEQARGIELRIKSLFLIIDLPRLPNRPICTCNCQRVPGLRPTHMKSATPVVANYTRRVSSPECDIHHLNHHSALKTTTPANSDANVPNFSTKLLPPINLPAPLPFPLLLPLFPAFPSPVERPNGNP
jgi:hypothetical protein